MTSVIRRRDHDDSGEYSDASQDIEHSNSLNDGQPESDYDSQGSDSEHSEGDPEAQEGERRVDDDEDRSNPQYIPKRGTFYEHDDRTAASGEETVNTTTETASEKKEGSEPATERRRPPRKSDIVNKWTHDKYNENEQVPKSRDELVAIYGYDIRNEDAPPHARRNRRYGRGPNKYTRTWEDEEAYRRQNALPLRKPPNPEDFPELEDSVKRPGRKPRVQRPRSKSQPANEPSEQNNQLRRNASIKTAKPKPVVKPAVNKTTPPKNVKPQDRKLPALENLTITASANNNNNNSQGQSQRKVSAIVAQQRPVPTDISKKKPHPTQNQQQTNPAPNKSPPLQGAHQKQNNQTSHQHPQTTGTESRGGSKRYSSLRQRPLAETYSPQTQPQTQSQNPPQSQNSVPVTSQNQPHRYVGQTELPASTTVGPHQTNATTHQQQQHLLHQVHRSPPVTAHAPSPPHQAIPQTQQVRLGIIDQQQVVSHSHHNIHNIQPPAHNISQIPPAQGYAPPAMMPTQYMQQSSTAPVFASGMYPQGTAPPQYPIYPHLPNNYGTQTGGVTYYNYAEQDQQPRAQRRPTAAIPIVKPHASERAANSTEKDNIDRIVENMFVRKPWPPTQGADKEKSEPRSSQEPASKESSQPNSLTSSSISTDSKPSDAKEEKEIREKEIEQTEA